MVKSNLCHVLLIVQLYVFSTFLTFWLFLFLHKCHNCSIWLIRYLYLIHLHLMISVLCVRVYLAAFVFMRMFSANYFSIDVFTLLFCFCLTVDSLLTSYCF